jgi:hypothetical protein
MILWFILLQHKDYITANTHFPFWERLGTFGHELAQIGTFGNKWERLGTFEKESGAWKKKAQ